MEIFYFLESAFSGIQLIIPALGMSLTTFPAVNEGAAMPALLSCEREGMVILRETEKKTGAQLLYETMHPMHSREALRRGECF